MEICDSSFNEEEFELLEEYGKNYELSYELNYHSIERDSRRLNVNLNYEDKFITCVMYEREYRRHIIFNKSEKNFYDYILKNIKETKYNDYYCNLRSFFPFLGQECVRILKVVLLKFYKNVSTSTVLKDLLYKFNKVNIHISSIIDSSKLIKEISKELHIFNTYFYTPTNLLTIIKNKLIIIANVSIMYTIIIIKERFMFYDECNFFDYVFKKCLSMIKLNKDKRELLFHISYILLNKNNIVTNSKTLTKFKGNLAKNKSDIVFRYFYWVSFYNF